MFKYISTTIINDAVDFTTNKPRWTYSTDVFNIKRVATFKKANVKAIYKTPYSAPVLTVAQLDMSDATFTDTGLYRIAMYIRLSGSQNSYYSNDFVFKGKPLYIEFEKVTGDNGTTLAKKVADIARKYLNMVYEFEIVKVTAKGDKVVISATDEYQRFAKVDIEKFDESAGMTNHVNSFGAFVVVASATPEGDKFNLVQGKEGFGTYQYMLKNFRLPTAANTRWTRIVQDETPILGAKYNQYIIEYSVERGIMGGDAVGDVTTSVTGHVFYVNQNVAADFEAGLAKIGTVTTQLKPLTIQKIEDVLDVPKAGTGKNVTPEAEDGGGTIAWVSAQSDADWLSFTPSASKVDITATTNNTSAERQAKATILVTGDDGATASQEITIKQLTT